MIEQTVDELTPLVGTRPACRALGAAPATIYRRRRPPEPKPPVAPLPPEPPDPGNMVSLNPQPLPPGPPDPENLSVFGLGQAERISSNAQTSSPVQQNINESEVSQVFRGSQVSALQFLANAFEIGQ